MTESGSKKNRNITLIIIILLLMLILWASANLFIKEEKQEEIKVSVILNDNNHSRWTAFKQGLEQAAKDEQVDLSLLPTGVFNDNEEILALIDQKLEDGAEGIIVSPLKSEDINDFVERRSKGVKILFVENDMKRNENTMNQIIALTPDYKEMANEIYRNIMLDHADDISGKNILLLCNNPLQLGVQEATDYLTHQFTSEKCKVLDLVNVSDENMKQFHFQASDIMIALDDISLSVIAKRAYEEKNVSYCIYGIGTSKSNVYYLEKGAISGMLVPNDFMMGYKSLSILADQLRNHNDDSQNCEITFQFVRSEQVHDPEIEKILYPVIE